MVLKGLAVETVETELALFEDLESVSEFKSTNSGNWESVSRNFESSYSQIRTIKNSNRNRSCFWN